jgi:hypothetical protein
MHLAWAHRSHTAQGLTRQILARSCRPTHRTVGSHLYRIFPKHGIATRAALRDALPPALDDEPGGARVVVI